MVAVIILAISLFKFRHSELRWVGAYLSSCAMSNWVSSSADEPTSNAKKT